MKRRWLPAALLCLLLLCSCAEPGGGTFYCRVVLEESPGFTCENHVLTVVPGQDAVFSIQCMDGYSVTGADCGDYTLAPNANGGVTLTVQGVRYSTVVSLTVERSGASILYDPNDSSGQPPVEVPVTPSHLRWNTVTDLFTRLGHCGGGFPKRGLRNSDPARHAVHAGRRGLSRLCPVRAVPL